MKAPRWGLAVAGATLGLTAGLPAVAVLGAVGAGLDVWRARHREALGAQTPSAQSPTRPLPEHHLRAARHLAPGAPDDALQYKAAVSRPPREALALWDFLQQHVHHRTKGDRFWKDDSTRRLVVAFQRVFNRDRGMREGIAPLKENGIFDKRTAGALALYMKTSTSSDPYAETPRRRRAG